MNWLAEKTIKHKGVIIIAFTLMIVFSIFAAPNVSINYQMADYLPEDSKSTVSLNLMNKEFDKNVIEIVQTEIKYKGYIDKTINEVEKMLKLETKKIPMDIDYSRVPNIATEARQKFDKIRPLTIGQASRISGVNPADITMLLVYLKKEYNHE